MSPTKEDLLTGLLSDIKSSIGEIKSAVKPIPVIQSQLDTIQSSHRECTKERVANSIFRIEEETRNAGISKFAGALWAVFLILIGVVLKHLA